MSTIRSARAAICFCANPIPWIDESLMKRIAIQPLLSIAFLFGHLPCFAQGVPVTEADQSVIEYKTVAEALTDLRAKPGVVVRVEGGWTIAEERKEFVMWSFAPAGHPAYPAVIKRNIYERDGTLFVRMSALCESSKPACDDLLGQFKKLNEGLAEAMQQQHQNESR